MAISAYTSGVDVASPKENDKAFDGHVTLFDKTVFTSSKR
jgi:hypothetical protein